MARSEVVLHSAEIFNFKEVEIPEKKKEPTIPTLDASKKTLNRDEVFAELGQTGDSFGGLTSLLTALAGALVAWAGVMQHQTLQQARKEAKDERLHRQRQEFESLFFQLLQLSAAATEKIERIFKEKPALNRSGSQALDSYARSIFKQIPSHQQGWSDADLLNSLIESFFTRMYDRSPSAFGPYFRLLYQTFKQVDDSDLTDDQKIRYANIARGQIGEGAVLLLALNGLTEAGFKFAPLIEKFGLLEHLHRRYRKAYYKILLLGYRPRAFMGSEERSEPENEWVTPPLLDRNHFSGLAGVRTQADFGDDFEYEPE